MRNPNTRQLVCEGSCNPSIKALDREVNEQRIRTRSLRVHGGLDHVMLALSDATLNQIRALHHTCHSPGGAGTWLCNACGATRRWGL